VSEISTLRPIERPAIPAVDPVPVATPSRPVETDPGGRRLDPAVTLALGSGSGPATRHDSEYRDQFIRDPDSRRIVYQVVDPATGDIVVQLPTETTLKARAYADAAALRSAEPGQERAAQVAGESYSVDRSA